MTEEPEGSDQEQRQGYEVQNRGDPNCPLAKDQQPSARSIAWLEERQSAIVIAVHDFVARSNQ